MWSLRNFGSLWEVAGQFWGLFLLDCEWAWGLLMFSKLFQGRSSFYFAVYRVLAFSKDREQVLGCVYLLISCEQEWCFHGLFPGLSAEWFCIQWENNTLALTQWSVSNHICLDNCFEMNFETLAGAHQKRKSWLMSEICYGAGKGKLVLRTPATSCPALRQGPPRKKLALRLKF